MFVRTPQVRFELTTNRLTAQLRDITPKGFWGDTSTMIQD